MRPWFIVGGALVLDLAMRVFFRLGFWTPDLLLIALSYLTLSYPLGLAYSVAFVAGLAWDGAYLDWPGLHCLLFVLAVMITYRLRQIIWAQYAVSRLVIGAILSAFMRFGEVIFWLSNRSLQVQNEFAQPYIIQNAKLYILCGAVMTGLVFMCIVWRSNPIRIARKTPLIVFSER